MNLEASSPLRIAVIGAGFSGLAAALQLQSLAKAAHRPLELTVFEGTGRAGGLVATERRDGYLIERGADSFITNKPGGVELCRRLGLDDRLIGTDPKYRKSFILHDGRPVATPEGFQLLAPGRWKPFLASPLLSWRGKVRASLEVVIPRRRDTGDESLASFIRRRFGSEILDRIVQPMVGGIYTSDPEQLSMQATLARFVEMERTEGSLIRALQSVAQLDPKAVSGARYGLFVTLPGGMEELITAARDAVQSAGHLLLSKTVSEVRRTNDGRGWLVRTGDECQEFDGVVLSTSAYQAADLMRTTNPKLAEALDAIEYASSAIVVSGHALSDIDHPLDGAGLVIPHIERRRILAVSFASRKFPGRAPEGRVLLRAFIGGAMQPEYFDRTDEEIKAIVREELASILGVRGTPDFCEVVRYKRGMPQYHVGHLDRVTAIERITAELPDLALCGNAYRGVGIPDAIQSGFEAAEKLWNRMIAARHQYFDDSMSAEWPGKRITYVREVVDYWQIGIGEGRLTVLVPFGIEKDGQALPPSDLVGHMVESCKEGSDAFVIQCDGGVTLLIDLREQNWPGPEAMTYSSSTGDLFVWRAEDSEKAALAKQ